MGMLYGEPWDYEIYTEAQAALSDVFFYGKEPHQAAREKLAAAVVRELLRYIHLLNDGPQAQAADEETIREADYYHTVGGCHCLAREIHKIISSAYPELFPEYYSLLCDINGESRQLDHILAHAWVAVAVPGRDLEEEDAFLYLDANGVNSEDSVNEHIEAYEQEKADELALDSLGWGDFEDDED
jgi:hypothetical protein